MTQLDSLRAIAILAVMYTHFLPKQYWLFNIYWGGVGVKLFFVLSGFLITQILLKCRDSVMLNQESNQLVLRQFYIRRFLRIFPLFYVTLAVAYLINIPYIRESICWHIFFLSNVFVALENSNYYIFTYFWALAVIEQFYLIWPLLILFTPRLVLLPVIVAIISIGPIFRFVSPIIGLNEVAQWSLAPSCFDTLGMGTLLACLWHQEKTLDVSIKKIENYFLIIGLSLLLLDIILPDKLVMLTSIKYPLIFTFIIAKSARGVPGIIGGILQFKPLVYLGKISFGMYVIHGISISMVNTMMNHFGFSAYTKNILLMALLWTTATIILSMLSWHFFENPINKLKQFFPYSIKRNTKSLSASAGH